MTTSNLWLLHLMLRFVTSVESKGWWDKPNIRSRSRRVSLWSGSHCLPSSSSPTCFSASLISSPPLCFSHTPSQSNKETRGRKANKPVVQRGRRGAGQRHEDGGNEVECCASGTKWRQSSDCLLYCARTCTCVNCMHAVLETPCMFFVWSFTLCLCVAYACRLSSGWLCSSSHSQLLITQHLFCPRSTLFCAYYQPGSLHRIRQRALSNTLLLKSLSSAVFSLVQHCRGNLCPCLLKAEHRAGKHLSPAVLAHSLNLSLELKPVYSVWWHYDNQERISSVPLPVSELPGVCFGTVWHAGRRWLAWSLEFHMLGHP